MTAPPGGEAPFTVTTLAAAVQPAADAWFTRVQLLALQELIRLAREAEQAKFNLQNISLETYRNFIKKNEIRGLDGNYYSAEALAQMLDPKARP